MPPEKVLRVLKAKIIGIFTILSLQEKKTLILIMMAIPLGTVQDLRILFLKRMEMIKLTLEEFEQNFSLHDSNITKIDYDAEKKKLNLEEFTIYL